MYRNDKASNPTRQVAPYPDVCNQLFHTGTGVVPYNTLCCSMPQDTRVYHPLTHYTSVYSCSSVPWWLVMIRCQHAGIAQSCSYSSSFGWISSATYMPDIWHHPCSPHVCICGLEKVKLKSNETYTCAHAMESLTSSATESFSSLVEFPITSPGNSSFSSTSWSP